MFEVGDIVCYYSPKAQKLKYHLCVGGNPPSVAFVFLFINSKKGYNGDCVMPDGSIPGLPRSPTGETVVSFSYLERRAEGKLKKFSAQKVNSISAAVARQLLEFAKQVPTLTREERRLVVEGLSRVAGEAV